MRKERKYVKAVLLTERKEELICALAFSGGGAVFAVTRCSGE